MRAALRTTRHLTRGAVLTALGAVVITATACGSDPSPVVDGSKLSGGSTTLKLDSAFAGQLIGLKLIPAAVGDAKLDLSTETLSVPVTDGNLKIYKQGDVTPTVQGEIDHGKDNGFTLKSGSTTLSITNLQLDPGTKARLFGDVAVDGKSTKTGVALFDLDSDSLQQPKVNGSSVTLTSRVKLDGGAAGLFNDTFKITALKGDTAVGEATTQVDTGK